MTQSNLAQVSYVDPQSLVRLRVYADMVVYDRKQKEPTLCAIRFGGEPEQVQAMSNAIYGGATIKVTGMSAEPGGASADPAEKRDISLYLASAAKQYLRQVSHDGGYATATLLAKDSIQTLEPCAMDNGSGSGTGKPSQPRRCYLFCPTGDREQLFRELDQKTSVPLIPAFRDYMLNELVSRGILRKLDVYSLFAPLEAWLLELRSNDENIVRVLEDGLRTGHISIPGSLPESLDGFDRIGSVTDYLNAFGSTVADRIRGQFTPLFDPASEPLSGEILEVNDCIRQRAGYSLYDAQLAVPRCFSIPLPMSIRTAEFVPATISSPSIRTFGLSNDFHNICLPYRTMTTCTTWRKIVCASVMQN